MTNDPFSSSVVPFEVPEQMRAFAEKGVSQARDNYAKFKEAAQHGNGTVEAVFGAVSKGSHAYSAKLLDFFQANTNAGFDFLQELVTRLFQRCRFCLPEIPGRGPDFSRRIELLFLNFEETVRILVSVRAAGDLKNHRPTPQPEFPARSKRR